MEFKYLRDIDPLLTTACEYPYNKDACSVINGTLENISRLTKLSNDIPINDTQSNCIYHNQMIGTLKLSHISGNLIYDIGRDQKWTTSQKIKVLDNFLQKIENICENNRKNVM